nr:hypothetical protein [Tanacetum cinerariifolium]
MVTESLELAFLAKESSQPQSSYEAAALLTKFELKKILIHKMDKSTQSQSKYSEKSVQSEEPEFEVAYSNMPQDYEDNPGNDDEEPKGKVISKRDRFNKPKRFQEPTDPDCNDKRTPQQGPTQSWIMTLASSVDKKYARGLESTHDVYSTERILALTRVNVMRKHGYGYLREIKVRRVDNDLYMFKEGDFPRLRINDIKDMLILIVHNRLTNLSGDYVSDFDIALRMFTRSMVIQRRVKDLQLGVKSY